MKLYTAVVQIGRGVNSYSLESTVEIKIQSPSARTVVVALQAAVEALDDAAIVEELSEAADAEVDA